MQNALIGITIVPGVFALLLFLVFSYLYEQAREPYFRAWQLAWAAYCLYYALLAWSYFGENTGLAFFGSKLLFAGVAMGILISTRLVQEPYRFRWSDVIVSAALLAVSVHTYVAHFEQGRFVLEELRWHVETELGIAVVLLWCAFRFWRIGRQRDSTGFRLLAISLIFWTPLLVSRPVAINCSANW